MIEGGWAYIWPAYGATISTLVVLTSVVVLRLRHWSKKARALETKSAP